MERVSDMSRKIGLHIIGGTSVPLGRPAVVKLVDVSSEYVAQVRRQVGTGTLIVVRWSEAEQQLDNPEARANRWCQRHMDQALQMLRHAPIAFEGYNEIADQQAFLYCRFEIARMRQLHAVGASVVVGNFSVGTPDFPAWTAYKPMLAAMGTRDYVGLHEYWADWESLHNTYHVRRFLRVPELAGKRLVITECGRDVVEGRGQPGWKRSNISEEDYLAELAELGRLYDACPQVVGACVFTVGGFGWGDFDVSGLWPHVVAEYAEPEPVEPPAERWEFVDAFEFDAGDEHLRSTIERRVR